MRFVLPGDSDNDNDNDVNNYDIKTTILMIVYLPYSYYQYLLLVLPRVSMYGIYPILLHSVMESSPSMSDDSNDGIMIQ